MARAGASLVLLFICIAAFLSVLAWLIGRILTDQYAWSQWLWWIPTPVMLPVVGFGMLGSLRPAREPKARRNRLLRWFACGAAVLIYFSIIEHRFLHAPPPVPAPEAAVKLVHWNFAHNRNESDDQVIDQLLAMNGDITVLTGPTNIGWDPRLAEQLDAGNGAQSLGLLTVLTRFPVISFRLLVVVDNMLVAGAEIDTTEVLGRPILLYMIDLPSSPFKHRMELARSLRTLLDEVGAPPPDLVVGDFNIIRGSASIHTMFPNLHEAFDEAGHGYAASFYRPFPMYLIDHVLLNAAFKAMRYDLVDPGLSRHKAQAIWFSTADK